LVHSHSPVDVRSCVNSTICSEQTKVAEQEQTLKVAALESKAGLSVTSTVSDSVKDFEQPSIQSTSLHRVQTRKRDVCPGN